MTDDLAANRQEAERFEDALLADLEGGADSLGGEVTGRTRYELEYLCEEGVSSGRERRFRYGFEVRELGRDQPESEGARGRSRTVLGCEEDLAAATVEEAEGIEPCVEIGRTTQTVTV